jgi:hypothetical protein
MILPQMTPSECPAVAATDTNCWCFPLSPPFPFLQALRQVLAQQQLPCGCQVYSHTLLVNQPAVLLSSAGRSLLRDACNMLQLPLQPHKHMPGE